MTNTNPPSPRAEYTRRMNRVLNHIDLHLDQPLDLQQLAGVANFSPFHFHRVFAAWMGETLGDYARRRRLEKAAFRLACKPAESVLQTALATGFGSGEAFARAFKLKFGCTPTEWRRDTRQRLAAQALAAPDHDACVTVPDGFDAAGSADLTTLPGGRYAVARFEGEPAAIANAWTWLTRNWLPDSGLLCDDRPCFEMFSLDTMTNPENGRIVCDICIPVRPL